VTLSQTIVRTIKRTERTELMKQYSQRDPTGTIHTLAERTCIFAIACGYEDAGDLLKVASSIRFVTKAGDFGLWRRLLQIRRSRNRRAGMGRSSTVTS
jgi:hypothetical protein